MPTPDQLRKLKESKGRKPNAKEKAQADKTKGNVGKLGKKQFDPAKLKKKK